jgi:hypothetical protein
MVGSFRCSLSLIYGDKEQLEKLAREDPDVFVTFSASPSRTPDVSP